MDISGGGLGTTVSYTNGQVQIAGGDGKGASVAVVNGELDLGSLVAALKAEGFSEDEILANLDGIVGQLEKQVDLKIKNKEAAKSYLSDKFESVSGSTTAGPVVAKAVTEESDESTQALLAVFQSNGHYVNPNYTPAGFDRTSASFTGAVNALNNVLANPGSIAAKTEFGERLQAYMSQFPHGDVMSALFLVFKESIEQTNKDKRYFLQRLSEMNEIAKSLGDYLEYLTERSNDLQQKIRDTQQAQGKDFQPGSVSVPVDIQRIDINAVSPDGKAITWVDQPGKPMNDTDMGYEIKNVETVMEEVRNKRQEFTTAFENFDQKANQLFNILSTVLKNMKEMEMGVTRNLL